jgi:alkyl hydroperoxide reductase subunit AhpC
MKPRKQGGLAPCNLPLLSDITKQIAKDYGVLIDEGENNGVAFRGTFIIDPKGVLRQMSVNDLPVGRNIDEVIRLIQAFQTFEKHGEVCPAKWKPGKKTMVADHDSNKLGEFWENELTKDFSKEQ